MSEYPGADPEFSPLEEVTKSTPEEFANLEAESQLEHERWHRRLAKLFRPRPSSGAEKPPAPESQSDLLHQVALEEKAEYGSNDSPPGRD